jgi:hypothetical protein
MHDDASLPPSPPSLALSRASAIGVIASGNEASGTGDVFSPELNGVHATPMMIPAATKM